MCCSHAPWLNSVGLRGGSTGLERVSRHGGLAVKLVTQKI
jgi:hypothetical protein